MATRLRPDGARRGRLFTSATFVGRLTELAALALVAHSAPAVALVSGEAGVGKTRLAQELIGQIHGRHVLVGRCHPLRDPSPLVPVVSALRGLAARPPEAPLPAVTGALRVLLPELAEHLPPQPEQLGDPRAERERWFRACRELLAASGPALVLLEDVHWADEVTLDFVTVLLRELPPALSVVLTYRREEVIDGSQLAVLASRIPAGTTRVTLELAPLDVAEVGELVRSLLTADEVSTEFVAYLHERTAGLPFALEEVLGLLLERHALARADGGWVRRTIAELAVPVAIRDAVLERLAVLPAAAQAVVRAAAVLGVAVAEPLLVTVAGLPADEGAEALVEGLAAGLLVEQGDGTYTFRHALAHDAVYEDVMGPRRRRLHLRAADALGGQPDPPVAQLCHHYQQAGDVDRWAHFAEAAADLAVARGDDQAAWVFLDQVMGATRLPEPVRVRLAEKLGRAALHGLTHTQAIPVLERVVDHESLAPATRGELRRALGLLLAQADDHAAARAQWLQALDDLPPDSPAAARLLTDLATPWVGRAPLRESLAHLERALERAAALADPLVHTTLLVNRAAMLAVVGDRRGWELGFGVQPDGRPVDQLREVARGRVNLGYAAILTGQQQRAAACLNMAERIMQTIDYPRVGLPIACNRVLLAWFDGSWDGLEDRIEDYLRLTGSLSSDVELVAALLAAAREHDDAEARLRAAFERASASGYVASLPAAAAGYARLLLDGDRVHDALAVAQTGLDLIRVKGIWAWADGIAPVTVEALCRLGHRTDAAAVATALAEGLVGLDAPAAEIALQVCEALLAEDSSPHNAEAATAFTAAAERWDALPRPYAAAQAREAAGRCRLAAGDASGTRSVVAAWEGYTRLGARRDARRARDLLRRHGFDLPQRRGRRGYGAALSPREAEVVALIATGATNAEIAERLFLSIHTVAHHVSSARRKLQAGNRVALAAAAAAAAEGSLD